MSAPVNIPTPSHRHASRTGAPLADSAAVGRPARIAVLGVHGVADQKPFETAREIADMFGAGAPEPERISFIEGALHLPVSPLSDSDGHKAIAAASPDPGIRHMAWKLGGHDPDAPPKEKRDSDNPPKGDLAYDTVRLRGKLPGEGAGPKAEVHVFEFYWADISRLGFSLVRGVVELYQLLFYLCSMSALTVKVARDKSGRWRPLTLLHWAVTANEWAVARFVPLLNLALAGIVLLLLPAALGDEGSKWLLRIGWPAIAGIALIIGAAWAVQDKRSGKIGDFVASHGFLAGFIAVLLVIGVAVLVLALAQGTTIMASAAVLVGLVAISLFLWVARIYDRRMPHAFLIAAGIALALVAALVFDAKERVLAWSTPTADIVAVAIRLAEWDLVLVYVMWMVAVMMGAASALLFLWIRYGRRSRYKAEQLRSRRAAWTGLIGAVWVPLVIGVLNPAVWSAMIHVVVPENAATASAFPSIPLTHLDEALDSTKHIEPLPARRYLVNLMNLGETRGLTKDFKPSSFWQRLVDFLRHKFEPPSDRVSARQLIRQMLNESCQPMPIIVCILVPALLLVIWSLAPAVSGDFPRSPNAPKPGPEESHRIGESLTKSYRNMRWVLLFAAAGTLFWLLTVGTDLCAALMQHPTTGRITTFVIRLRDAMQPWAIAMVTTFGVVVVAFIVLSQGPLRGLALGFRAALDVALDVVNWLRPLPAADNVCSRITARYVSLLRHLCDARSGYDAVVIVAHSQGCVIVADIMRYLRMSGTTSSSEPRLERWFDGRLPIHLFTMGNPLRQLYSLRFPHLYDWTRRVTPDEEMGPTAAGAAEDLLNQLGLRSWINAYRSGDYIGRCLWRTETHHDAWTPEKPATDLAAHPTHEFCIGAGAHTHYWDHTAPDIAEQLRNLVRAALPLETTQNKPDSPPPLMPPCPTAHPSETPNRETP